MPVAYVTEQDFEQEVLKSPLPVLIDFTAEWCQPCKVVAPQVEAVARDLEGKAKVFKVDIDRSKRLATTLRIQSVPSFVVFVKGRPVVGEQGVLKRAQLAELLDPYLPRAEGAIKVAELVQLIQEGQVVPVDTREASTFNRAHIPNAVNLPLDELESRLAELHMLQGEPVLYCRTGDKTKELADKLTASGVPVNFLEGGFLAWESNLLPVERPD